MDKSLSPYKLAGMVLRQIRQDCGLSQRQMAAIANVSQPTIYRWEKGLDAPDIVQASAIERLTGKDIRVF